MRDARLVNAVVAEMRAEILQPIKIVLENVTISRRQAIVVHYSSQRAHDVVQLPRVVASMGLHVLQLIQLLLGPDDPALIAAEWEGGVLHVVEIFANSREQMHAPVIAPERVLAIVMECIAIPVKALTTIARSAVTGAIEAAIVSAATGGRRRSRIAPHDVECVAFPAIIGILDANDRRAAVTWIANQLLTPAAVNARKAEIAGILRQRSGAFKTPPLGRSTRKISKVGGIAVNFHFNCPVHDNFNGTFSAIWRPTTADLRHPAYLALAVHCATGGRKCNCRKEKSCAIHLS
jgi:hypothetical protein